MDALAKYRGLMAATHNNTVFTEAGLFICKEHLFLPPTPDMLVECSWRCCSAGVVEVKCPWNVRNRLLIDLLKDSNSCAREVDGELKLKQTHRYYWQTSTNVCVQELC